MSFFVIIIDEKTHITVHCKLSKNIVLCLIKVWLSCWCVS